MDPFSKLRSAAQNRERQVNLNGESLKEIPSTLWGMTQLVELRLSSTSLSEIPPDIQLLGNLEILDLSFNHINNLPPEIGRLSNLRQLTLSSNQLVDLPVEIGLLKKLEVLNINNNGIRELPKEIGCLGRLAELHAEANQLRALPESLAKLRSLTQLNLARNRRLRLPPEVLARSDDPAGIIDLYLQEPKVPLNEAKLLIVGDAEVGKTSLVNRLLKNHFNPQQEMTRGIVIERLRATVEGRSIRLNVWDFGGQEIMHATHQFFLTERSVYVLVVDSRRDDQGRQMETWLTTIRSFGNDSPIILVCNKCDEQAMDADWEGLRLRHRTLRCVVDRASCKTGEGIAETLDHIREQVAELDHVGDLVPERHIRLKARLEKLRAGPPHYILSYDDYQDICREEGIISKLSQRRAIRLLHDLGVVLCFSDHPRLAMTSILDPGWVTGAVYEIITDHGLMQNQGQLEVDRLSEILADPVLYPPDSHKFIIEMMRRFELCFDFPNSNKSRILIPGLLSRRGPALGWNAQNKLNFEFHYDILPIGILSRFIVRMQYNLTDPPTYWLTGVLLEIEGNRTLVVAHHNDRKVKVSVNGPTQSRRSALAIVRNAFKEIHVSVARIGAKEKIALPDDPEVVVDYDHLLTLEREGHEAYWPEGASREYRLRELLDGIEDSPQRYDVLLCYNQVDRESAIEIERALRQRGIEVWVDYKNVLPGKNWKQEVQRAMQRAACIAVLLGETGLTSNVDQELRWCREEASTRNIPVIPVLLHGGRMDDLPGVFTNNVAVDFRSGIEGDGLDLFSKSIAENRPGV